MQYTSIKTSVTPNKSPLTVVNKFSRYYKVISCIFKFTLPEFSVLLFLDQILFIKHHSELRQTAVVLLAEYYFFYTFGVEQISAVGNDHSCAGERTLFEETVEAGIAKILRASLARFCIVR